MSAAAEKAQALNTYFASIFTTEDTSTLKKAKSDLPAQSTVEVGDITFTKDEVLEVLYSIDPDKSCGPDNVPGRLLKEAAPWITEPLAHLFNLSMSTGSLPQDWTRANITPIFKKGDKHSPCNYRPVSLTSLISKVMERLIHAKLKDFLIEHKKLNPLQHGFRSGYSCQTQLLETIHHWAQSLNDQTTTHAVFLDFSKAFDTVPHKRLILKLDHIGIRGKVLKWIQAFLCHRHQRVVINGVSSTWLPVTSGVPQGSVLGPLLFLLYINDLADNLNSDCRLFADDCTLYRRVTSLHDCAKLQADLSKLYRWTQRWQLHLNISKCKVLCISNKRAPPYMAYTINNATLEWVNSYKYLGIRITSHLRWSEQCRDAASKAMKILNLLRRTMHGTSTEAKKRAFVMLVRPHLEYAAPVWSPHVQRDIETLEHVQRRAAHWICSKWDRTNRKWSKTYEEARKELSWPSIRDRHIFLTFCQIFKIIHSLDCINFDSYLSYSSRPSRSHNQTFRCVPSRLNCYRFSFFINAPFLWNSLPPQIVSTESYLLFKSRMRNYLLHSNC